MENYEYEYECRDNRFRMDGLALYLRRARGAGTYSQALQEVRRHTGDLERDDKLVEFFREVLKMKDKVRDDEEKEEKRMRMMTDKD